MGHPGRFLAAVVLILFARTVWARDFALVRDGKPAATIVMAPAAGPKVKAAADDLQAYVEKMSGARLPLATDAAVPAGPLILVGASRLTTGLKPPIPAGLTPGRRDEGFVIVCRGDRLVLAGNDDGPYHGTEYAVSDLLNRLGVRWFMPGDYGEVVPRQATLQVPEMAVSEKPDFAMRNWWLHIKPELAEQERRWKIHNKMNPDPLFAIPGDSSVRNILPADRFFKEHPDYFATNADGTRNQYMPNLTNPAAVQAAAGVIEEYLRAHPGETSYGFAPDDGMPRDYTAETAARNQGFVTPGGRPGVPGEVSTTEEWLQFVNNVAAEVHKQFPGIYIATNGYANRNNPPQGVKLDDHLVIMFAAIWSCTLHAYDDPACGQKVRQGQMLRQWCKLCPNVWIYGYNDQMLVSGLTPMPETRKLRRDFPLWKRWGVLGFHDESRNVWAECGIPSRYLRAKLEWKADADADALLTDFYASWYGPAAGPMRAFYDAIEDAIEKTPLHGHEDRILPYVYTPALLGTLRRRMDEAKALALEEPVRTHVKADSLILDHLDAYMAMSEAEFAGKYAEAARQADRMLAIRRDLHAVNPFYIWNDEDGYHTGVWYWKITDRAKFYRELAERTSGVTGDLVALLPGMAQFRTDPADEGVFAEWYAPQTPPAGWATVSTTRPFYCQGYEDARGFPFVGNAWYRLRVQVPASARGRKVRLYAPAVETEAWCWVNGRYVGHRPYLEAYTRPCAIDMDVTDALRPGQMNDITIRVNTSLSPDQMAGGLVSRLFLYAAK